MTEMNRNRSLKIALADKSKLYIFLATVTFGQGVQNDTENSDTYDFICLSITLLKGQRVLFMANYNATSEPFSLFIFCFF